MNQIDYSYRPHIAVCEIKSLSSSMSLTNQEVQKNVHEKYLKIDLFLS